MRQTQQRRQSPGRGWRSWQTRSQRIRTANESLGADNGRFLRHRPKRSKRCLNYEKLYQCQGPLPKSQGVPEGPLRKNHVGRLFGPEGYPMGFNHDRDAIQYGGDKRSGRKIVVMGNVMVNQCWCRVPNAVTTEHANLPVSSLPIVAVSEST